MELSELAFLSVLLQLADEMPQKAEIWARVAAKHGLKEPDMAKLVGNSWIFTE